MVRVARAVAQVFPKQNGTGVFRRRFLLGAKALRWPTRAALDKRSAGTAVLRSQPKHDVCSPMQCRSHVSEEGRAPDPRGSELYPDKPATAAVHASRSTKPRSWSAGTGTQRACFTTRWLCKVVTTFSGFWYLGQPQAFFCYFGIDLLHGGVIISVLK